MKLSLVDGNASRVLTPQDVLKLYSDMATALRFMAFVPPEQYAEAIATAEFLEKIVLERKRND